MVQIVKCRNSEEISAQVLRVHNPVCHRLMGNHDNPVKGYTHYQLAEMLVRFLTADLAM